MVPPKQLKKYLSQGAIVIWTSSKPDQESPVTLQGWNHAREIEKDGVPR